MSAVEEVRDQLVALQIEQDADKEALEQATAELEAVLKERTLREQLIQQRRNDILAMRRELAKQEALAESRAQAHEVEEGVEALRSRFERIAQGKLWYEGTGNEDAILDHQWQGMMFGAVARRWILADGVGLGKTRTCVGWLDLIKARKVIIVCEANICSQFAGEVMSLAPERTLYNLCKTKGRQQNGVKTSAVKVRQEILDDILSRSEAVVVVNFEIWRRDKDVLAKLMNWQADTLIVDEAHNLKSTSTANFKNIRTLLSVDNTCPNCGSHIFGLWNPVALKQNPSRKVPEPCRTCGWKSGEATKTRYGNKLEELLASRSIKNVCFTTGTPILNDPSDLFALLHLANPVLFKTLHGFQTTYLTNNHFSGKWDFRDGALANLKPLIEGIFLARTLADTGVELPPQRIRVIPVELAKEEYPKQLRTIKQISEAAQIVLDSGEAMTIMHLIALITRKRQANVWPGGIVIKDTNKNSPTYGEVLFDAGTEIDESVKMDVIFDNIVSLNEQGHRQIVFSQFKTALTEFEKRLSAAGIRVARFDGDTPEKLRKEIKANFDRAKHQEAKWDVVLANYKTGGTGLNFTEATITHIMDEEWNPGKRDQGYGRTHRLGQTEDSEVFVYRIPHTIDTWMANTIKRKEQIINGFNETMGVPEQEQDLAMDLREAMRTGELL